MSARRPRPPAGDDRKTLQLAAQIGRSIESTLVGECRDEVLQNLSVEKVEPAPGHRMLVTLCVHPPGSALAREEVLARLEAQRGFLVERLVQDVNRRNLPELSFWVVRAPDAAPPAGAADPGGDGADDDGADDDGAGDDGAWDAPSILDDV